MIEVFRDRFPKPLDLNGRYVEFLGGLGDVLNRCHQCDWYTSLTVLKPGERVVVGLMCHNSSAADLFRWIPTRGDIYVLDIGFSESWNDPIWRAKYGLPTTNFRPYDIRRVDYYPSQIDIETIDELYRIGPYIALVSSAGTPERNIPVRILEDAVGAAITAGFKVVQVGSRYARRYEGRLDHVQREEIQLESRYGLHSMIDRLSVPGSLKVIERAAGVMTAHTALCLASWYVRQPTFLLYNAFVKKQYVPLGPYGYMFGMARPSNDHMEFSEYSRERFERFLKGLA